MKPPIALFSLGGTIAMRQGPAGLVPAVDADDLIGLVPDIREIADVTVTQVARVPSADVTIAHLIGTAEGIRTAVAAGAGGIVVVQGTDTIEEAAFALDLLLDVPVPVVVTGAMRPACHISPDGPANLANAVRVAAGAEARGLGVVVVMNDEIHAARYVTKGHSVLPNAFGSPSLGPVGHLREGRVVMPVRLAHRVPTIAVPADAPPRRVAHLPVGLDDDPWLLEALASGGCDGLVVEALGGGHVPSRFAEPLGALAGRTPVVLAARTHAGATLERSYGYAGSERDLIGRGLIPSGDLGAAKARVLLMLLLMAGAGRAAVARDFRATAGPGLVDGDGAGS